MTKEREFPQTRCHEIVSHIIVGRTAFLPHVQRICRIRRRGWILIRNDINALSPPVVRCELKTSRETTRERSQHSVVARIGIRRREKHPRSKKIAWVIRKEK